MEGTGRMQGVRFEEDSYSTPPTKALRYNEGKVDLTFLEGEFLRGVAKVFMQGAEKYSRDNWKKSIGAPEHQEYRDSILQSLLRHVLAVMDGELIDPESGQTHLAHVGANVQMMMTYDASPRLSVEVKDVDSRSS